MNHAKDYRHSPRPGLIAEGAAHTTVYGARLVNCVRTYIVSLLTVLTYPLLSAPAHALTYQWPVLTDINVVLESPVNATYYIKWTVMTVVDPSIGESESLGSVYEKKMGKTGGSKLTTAVRHRHQTDSVPTGGTAYAVVDNTATTPFREHAMSVVSQATNLSKVVHSGSPNGSECVGLMTYPWGLNYWSELLSANWDGGTGVAGQCLGTPPPHEWCAMTTPTLTFEYGTMTLANAQGATRTKTVGVECTTGMKYTLRLRGENDVPLSNGMKAGLQADGQPLNSPLDGSPGQNTVSLTSTLEGEPDRTGEFRGESVLFVSYP